MAAIEPLIAIVGETASGKTALAVELAKQFNGEIICADSRTIYKHLDIGTAKPTTAEQQGIPHHLLDVIEPNEGFTVAQFKQMTVEVIEDITFRGKLPIMVGGSGLYVDSVLFDYQFNSASVERDEVNPRHLKASNQTDRETIRDNTLVLGMQVDRDELHDRITNRVDSMIAHGFLREVQWASEQYGWDSPGLLAPGYKAFRAYLNGSMSLDEAKLEFIKNDMQLAKRQRTWFKRNRYIHWLNNQKQAVELITTFLNTMV